MPINLPSLAAYRSAFLNEGLHLPLPIVPAPVSGLKAVLPRLAHDRSGWPFTEETLPSLYNIGIQWPKITIVTPSYNQGAFIEQTIRSVLLQNYPNLEYIIMDGGSNDGTDQILEKYASYISFWQSKADHGQGQAINHGFSIASGEIYGWINSDDFYLKDVFFEVAQTFIKSKTEFVYGYGFTYWPASHEYRLQKLLPHTDYFIKLPSLLQPSTFWASSIHQPIWEDLHCAIDYELWLRMIKGKKRKLIKKALSVAHAHDDAKTFDPKMKTYWDADQARMWDEQAHGRVHEWKKIVFLNRIRARIYKLLRLI